MMFHVTLAYKASLCFYFDGIFHMPYIYHITVVLSTMIYWPNKHYFYAKHEARRRWTIC